MMQKPKKMTKTLAHRYSSESTLRELSNEYRHVRVRDGFQKSLHPTAVDESNLSTTGRVDPLMIRAAKSSLAILTKYF